MSLPQRVASGFAVLAAASAVVGAVVAIVSEPQPAPAIATFLFAAAIGGLTTALGVVVTRQRPENVVGALLATIGLSFVVLGAGQVVVQAAANAGELSSFALWAIALTRECAVWSVVAFGLLMLFFPDGRLPGPRWRWVPPAMIGGAVAFQLLGAVDPTPYPAPLHGVPRIGAEALPRLAPQVRDVFQPSLLVAFIALVFACIASLVVRFHRADELQRRQLKWLVLAAAGLPIYGLVEWAAYSALGPTSWPALVVGVATIVGIPVSITIAILRYDLYDVDKALASTVTYGALTAVLFGLYAAASFVGGLVIGPDSTVTAAAATALCAVAFVPVRRGAQRRVDRRLYPRRRAVLAAIESLVHETRTGNAPPERLQSVLREALDEPELRVGYVVPGASGFVDTAGQQVVAEDGAVIVKRAGRPIGIMSTASPGQRELLQAAATASDGLIEVIGLRLELAAALRDVEASRARLVEVGERERRSLERDLHDGSQQRLVALGMTLRLAQRHLSDGTVDLDGLLDQSVAELGTAVAELREIAHGLRPSRLDDGLLAALTGLAERLAIPLDMDVTSSTMPDDVAAVAYYVASEAVTNAVKHADAERIGVRVVRLASHVEVRVEDDGRGGATIQPGSGLAGLLERVSNGGGSLSVASVPGSGTVVEAVLPCAS